MAGPIARNEPAERASLDACLACGGDVNCGSAPYRDVEQVGRWRVTDATGERLMCTKCGEGVLTLDEVAGYQRRAARSALVEWKLEGAVLRYARKALGLTQKELAEALDVAPEAVARWENDEEPFGQRTALAVALLLDVAAEGGAVRGWGEECRGRRSAAQAGSADPGKLKLSVPQPRGRI